MPTIKIDLIPNMKIVTHELYNPVKNQLIQLVSPSKMYIYNRIQYIIQSDTMMTLETNTYDTF